ncbi:hypothetical protein J2X03_000868 [Microbacterium trichothecenolyticum]|nr:hypothetical protein [Microbacterium trichothecenolyticum]MDR7111004.1 hypothetical protein [Microbacterium trichothecenolyticum]
MFPTVSSGDGRLTMDAAAEGRGEDAGWRHPSSFVDWAGEEVPCAH